MYKIRGRVIDKRVEDIEPKKGEVFKKMFVTIVETDSGFDHKHQFELFGDSSIELQQHKIKIDRYVKIEFYIKSNEWKDKFFNTLSIKDVHLEDEVYSVDDMPFTD